VNTSAASPKKILVLMLDSDSKRLQQLAKVVAGAIQAEVQTCNTPLGCLDLARRYRPQIALIHSREAVVENVSMVDLLRAVSPLTEVRIID
jgi:hypothetical protein